jgi:peptidoglycan L-alanyl-D-glutamate endopeptidase CwlK
MNQASETRLSKVHPELAKRARLLIDALAAKGFPFEVVQGLRTYAEQDALFAQCRTKPGNIVTRARGGQSNHNFGLAVDICPVRNGKLDWNWRTAFLTIDSEAEKVGLLWGGDWHKFLDLPHVELAGPPLSQCRALFSQGGLAKVWAAVKTA